MARSLRLWIGVALGGCLVAFVAALSPVTSLPRNPPEEVHASSWGARAGTLARAWGKTYEQLRLAQYRAALEPLADSARRAGGAAPLLLIDGPSTPGQRRMLSDQLAQMWKRADPEGFKVAVALVLVRDSGSTGAPPDSPRTRRDGASSYFFPDSAHRTLCVAVVPAMFATQRFFASPNPVATAQTVTWLAQSLGPCAFYGAFGTPGPTAARWLRGQGFEFTLLPHWWMRDPPAGQPVWWVEASGQSWWWGYFYSALPFDGIACYAGRLPRCLTSVYDSTALADSAPTSWNTANWWRNQGFLSGTGYLSDVVAAVGADRFSRLWTTDLPFDSAFHLAVDTSLMDWTGSWARRNGPHITIGGAPPPGTLPGGLIVSALALSLAVWYARRRQIG